MSPAQASREVASTAMLHRFAAALHDVRPEDLNDADAHKARLCLIDFLACALTARDLPWSRQAIEAACANTGHGPADIIGTGIRTSALDAAFANAVLGHALVRDDMHLASISHLGVVVIPALLALGQTRAASGRSLLAAIVAGYEAGGKLGRLLLDVEVARIHRPTGLVGAFAATAAAGRLLGLDAQALASALAIALNTSAGYNEWASTGGSEMFFHPGFAARNALTCCSLASSGAWASPSALEGRAGLLSAFGKEGLTGAGAPYCGERSARGSEIQAVFFKEVPACNFAQTPAQVARAIAVEHGPAPDDVEDVLARVTYAAASYPGCNATGPFEHVLQAKMSIQYNVAAALATGRFDENAYDPLARPDIAALARRIRIEVDDELTGAYPEAQGAKLSVTLRDGRRLEGHLPDVEPASDRLVRERLRAIAEQRLGSGAGARLLECLDGIEHLDDAGLLVQLTRID